MVSVYTSTKKWAVASKLCSEDLKILKKVAAHVTTSVNWQVKFSLGNTTKGKVLWQMSCSFHTISHNKVNKMKRHKWLSVTIQWPQLSFRHRNVHTQRAHHFTSVILQNCVLPTVYLSKCIYTQVESFWLFSKS